MISEGMVSDSFVSVVLVQCIHLQEIENVLQEIQQELEKKFTDYEIVIIGKNVRQVFSVSDEYVLNKINGLRYIQLTQTVDHDVSWAAGLENAIGDFIVLFDPETEPISVISETVSICKKGFDVVVGVADQKNSFIYKALRPLVARILNTIDYSLPKNATTLRCLSRRAVNSVTSTGRFHHQFSMRIQKTGYPQTEYQYKILPERAAAEKSRTLLSRSRDLIRLIVFNSSRPLRWMSVFGIAGSIMAFLFALYSLLIHLIKGNVVEGWTTTILFISALFSIQFIMMAFFSEYFRRMLDDRSDKADYSILFEKNSIIMVHQDRVNVHSSPEVREENLVQSGRRS